MKIRKLLLFVFISICLLPRATYAAEVKKGDIKNPEISVKNEDVTITKRIIKNDQDMEYLVEFTIEGKNTVDTVTKDVYVSVLFDRSGSMLCSGGTRTNGLGILSHSTTINDQKLYCDLFDEINLDKWNSAVNGAIDFSSDLLLRVPTARLNLFTFSDQVSENVSWQQQAFQVSDFSYPNGATNLHLAVNAASEKLKQVDPNALKYLLIISDGEPSNLSLLEEEIVKVKDAGIQIYAIGYDTTSETEKILQSISSGEEFYYQANSEGIGTALQNISSVIQNHYSATDGVLTDTIGEGFLYSGNDSISHEGNVVRFPVSEVGNTPVVLSFPIVMNDSLDSGWYATNQFLNSGVSFVYKNSSGEEKKISFDSSSEVYWEKEKRPYVIRYYKDVIDSSHLLGKEEGMLELGSTLLAQSIDRDKYLPLGYTSEKVELSDLLITEEANVIDILYSKRSYPYHIEYYQDEITLTNLIAKSKDISREYLTVLDKELIASDFGEDWLNLYRPKGYFEGVFVDSSVTIDLENNVVKVLYSKRNDLSYQIEYYFDGKLDESKTKVISQQVMGEQIDDLEFPKFDFYQFQKVDSYPLSISEDNLDNVIRVYYESIKSDPSFDAILPPNTMVSSSSFPLFLLLTSTAMIGTLVFIIKKYNCVNSHKK